MTEIEDLRSLVEVVESGSFNRAATRLGVSKSIVSRRIARLEADLGIRLLRRTTRGVSPTEAGLEFKARSERILAELEEAREAIAQQENGVAGRLRLSVPLSFGVHHMGPVVADLARQHPRLEMDISYSDRIVDLIGEGFDAAVRIGRLRDSSLVARRIAPIRTILVASPDYLDRRGRPKTPGDLVAHDCLIYTGRAGADWHFRAGSRRISVRPGGRMRADSGDAIVQWALEGLGIAEVPTFIVAHHIDSGRLVPLLTDYALPEHGLYVVRPPGAYVPRKVRVLIDTLLAHFSEPSWDSCMMKSLSASRKG